MDPHDTMQEDVDWATLVYKKVQRQAVINTAIEFWVPKKVESF
jgi:hypothetical protein